MHIALKMPPEKDTPVTEDKENAEEALCKHVNESNLSIGLKKALNPSCNYPEAPWFDEKACAKDHFSIFCQEFRYAISPTPSRTTPSIDA